MMKINISCSPTHVKVKLHPKVFQYETYTL